MEIQHFFEILDSDFEYFDDTGFLPQIPKVIYFRYIGDNFIEKLNQLKMMCVEFELGRIQSFGHIICIDMDNFKKLQDKYDMKNIEIEKLKIK